MSMPQPFLTAWMSDPMRFYTNMPRLLVEFRSTALPYDEPFSVDLRVGQPCLVRGMPCGAKYDRWCGGTVQKIERDFECFDGVRTDRFTVAFVDFVDGACLRLEGVFYSLWGEVCHVGQESMVLPMCKATFVNMVKTRGVYTPLVATCVKPDGTTFTGPMWTPAFIENVIKEGGETSLEVRFVHFFGGMTSHTPAPCYVFEPFFNMLTTKKPNYETSVDLKIAQRCTISTPTGKDIETTFPLWRDVFRQRPGKDLVNFGLVHFECRCNAGPKPGCQLI